MPNLQIGERLINFLMFLPVFLLSISVHEYSPAFFANKYGYATAKNLGRLTLNPFKHIDLVGSVIMPLAVLHRGLH